MVMKLHEIIIDLSDNKIEIYLFRLNVDVLISFQSLNFLIEKSDATSKIVVEKKLETDGQSN